MKLLLIGIDGFAHQLLENRSVNAPNLEELLKSNFKEFELKPEWALSAVMWNAIFSGKHPEELKDLRYTREDEDGKIHIVKYEELPEDLRKRYIWETLARERPDLKVVVVNAPVVLPPWSNVPIELEDSGVAVDYEPNIINMGITTETILRHYDADVGIVVFTEIDRISHFFWGEKEVFNAYENLDQLIGIIMERIKPENYMIVSDHGFRDLPKEEQRILRGGQQIKGDHSTTQIYAGSVEINRITELRDAVLRIIE